MMCDCVFVLVRRMWMSESDAAQVAVRIGNILRQKGKPNYFDPAPSRRRSGGAGQAWHILIRQKENSSGKGRSSNIANEI